MNDRLKKGIALALAMLTVNASMTWAAAVYAAEPNSAAQTPYYQPNQVPAAGAATMDRYATPVRDGSASAPVVPVAPTMNNPYGYGNYYPAPPSQPLPLRTGPTLDQMVVDGLILRPVMLVATALGASLFIATLPASLLGGNVSQAARKMVVEPAESTFATCLGCLMERNQSKYESWH